MNLETFLTNGLSLGRRTLRGVEFDEVGKESCLSPYVRYLLVLRDLLGPRGVLGLGWFRKHLVECCCLT